MSRSLFGQRGQGEGRPPSRCSRGMIYFRRLAPGEACSGFHPTGRVLDTSAPRLPSSWAQEEPATGWDLPAADSSSSPGRSNSIPEGRLSKATPPRLTELLGVEKLTPARPSRNVAGRSGCSFMMGADRALWLHLATTGPARRDERIGLDVVARSDSRRPPRLPCRTRA